MQTPDLIQTAIGGKRMARRPRKMSPLHIVMKSTQSIEKRIVDASWWS